jgi:predicted regulator of Ras-like GTPase activity (Roadblock/LC7/MglB family)
MAKVYRVDILEDRLRQLAERTPGIQGTVIVSIEGFVVAAYPPAEHGDYHSAHHPTSTPQVAAMAATLIALGEQTLTRLAQGKVERLMIEGEDGAMIVYPINRNAALAAMIDKKAKIGLTLMAVSRTAAALADVLSGTD